MSDIMSILQSSYAAAPQSLISPGSKFANVDPTKYQGTWTGKDYSNQPFTISITKVSGYRAPSRANQPAFDQAVAEVARATQALLDGLVVHA